MSDWITETVDQPVVYAGTHDIGELSVPILREGLPRAVTHLTPTHWVVADPWTFPFEHLTGRQLDAPIDVILPPRAPHEGYYRTIDHSILRHLGPYDSVACSPELWDRHSQVHRWNTSQRVVPHLRVEDTARSLLRRTRTIARLSDVLEPDHLTNWDVRTRQNKARYRAELAILRPLVAEVLEKTARGTEARVLEIGSDVGRYLSEIAREGCRLSALRLTEGVASQLRFNRFDTEVIHVGSSVSITQPPESVDLIVSSLDYAAVPEEKRRRLLNRMLGSLRVGGSIIMLLRLDLGSRTRVSDHLAILIATSGPRLVRETLVSVKNPNTGRSDTAIVTFTKIGVPGEW